MIRAEASLLLPPGSRLLHIGPPETGAAALQAAFHARRGEVAAQGVHYAGRFRAPILAACAITRTRSAYAGGNVPSLTHWRDLVGEIEEATEPRVVISSEAFADADSRAIRAVAEALDPNRLHVVVTLRPLVQVLPTAWQESVLSGLTTHYDAWLEQVFDQPEINVSRSFWHRHRHHELVARWADAVGSDNVTVIVGDERDPDRTLRPFEQLLGLSAGTLVPDPDLRDRPLTFAEAETIRAFNIAFRQADLGTQLHARLMRYGAAGYLKQRPVAPDEANIHTPVRAGERAAAIAREIADGIAASGVRVVGDLARLAPPFGGPAEPEPSAPTAPPDDAARAWPQVGGYLAAGILLASGLAPGPAAKAGIDRAWPDEPIDRGSPPPLARVEPIELTRVTTPRLAVMLLRRAILRR